MIYENIDMFFPNQSNEDIPSSSIKIKVRDIFNSKLETNLPNLPFGFRNFSNPFYNATVKISLLYPPYRTPTVARKARTAFPEPKTEEKERRE